MIYQCLWKSVVDFVVVLFCFVFVAVRMVLRSVCESFSLDVYEFL